MTLIRLLHLCLKPALSNHTAFVSPSSQAEHDPEARPILVTTDESLISRVDAELK